MVMKIVWLCQPTNQPANQMTGCRTDQLTNQSSDQSMDQSINQLISQPLECRVLMFPNTDDHQRRFARIVEHVLKATLLSVKLSTRVELPSSRTG